METCNNELIDLIISQLSKAPDSQINDKTRTVLKTCNELSYPEKYDILVNISKDEDNSSFVRVLCDLEKYYLRAL